MAFPIVTSDNMFLARILAGSMVIIITTTVTFTMKNNLSIATVDALNPVLPIKRNLAKFPEFGIPKVMQDLYIINSITNAVVFFS